ncbi:MAG TPA: hypothetical protein VK211_13200 [Kamptonema sp.]|nr:hypothetical protein [Kamptonema sp.]
MTNFLEAFFAKLLLETLLRVGRSESKQDLSSDSTTQDWLLNIWVAILVACSSLVMIAGTLYLCSFSYQQITEFNHILHPEDGGDK